MTEPTNNAPPDKRSPSFRSQLVIIGLSIILMASAVYVVGASLQSAQQPADLDHTGAVNSGSPSIPVEEGVFEQASHALEYLETARQVQSPRQLWQIQERRAYNGAPPIIPHSVEEGQQFGGNACLQCHEAGGYVPQMQAYTPVVPHPELINCRQCHVPVQTDDLFVESDWQTLPPPAIHQTALIGSPPVIPHDLQLRENCLACHAGPGVPQDVRVSHPERINCRQCHALQETTGEWSR